MRLLASKKSELALQAIKRLATAGQTISGATLARQLKTSPAFLSQCLTPLVAQGWVVSKTGPEGGYTVAPRLKRLSVLQVIEAIEGPTVNQHCVVSDRRCGIDPPCSMHATWAVARSALQQSLSRQSAL